jgi:hypothetical protein
MKPGIVARMMIGVLVESCRPCDAEPFYLAVDGEAPDPELAGRFGR